jgi:hypothetical protein
MADSTTLDSIFYISLAGLFFGSIGMCIKYGFKSKCVEFQCLCIKIKRDAIEENKEVDEIPSEKV